MLVKTQMVPMPITAAEKFREAAFFHNAMITVNTNVRLFPYYLSAFLAALRSVTDYIEKQAQDRAELAEWWKATLQTMKDDPLLKFLKGKRDSNIHQEPPHIYFWHGPKFPERHVQRDEDGEAYIETNHFEWSSTTDDRGEIRVTMKVGKQGVEENVDVNVRWTFEEDDEKCILSYSYEGLEKVDAIVNEFAALRQKLGLTDELQGHDSPSTSSES